MAILQDKKGLSAEDLKKIRSLRPGMPLDIQVATPTAAKRIRTEFLGMDGNRTIMMRYPDESKWGNLRDALYIENAMIVRFILEDETGEVVAFKSKIVFIVTKPVHMIFVQFPSAVQSQGLRSEKRAQLRIPVTVVGAKSGEILALATLMDISNGGCKVGALRNKTKKIEEKDIEIKLNNQDGSTTDLLGTIMNVKPDEMYFYYGIKFSTEESEVEKLINRLMIAL